MVMRELGMGAIALTFAVLLAAAFVFSGDASPRAVVLFCDRHDVTLTPTNIPALAQALVTTTRWRRAGMAVGLVAGMVWALYHHEVRINFTAMLLGWFVGGLVAQWLTNAPRDDRPRRRVQLSARTIETVLPAASRMWLVVGVTTMVALAAWAVPAAVRGEPGARQGWLLGMVEVLAGAVALAACIVRVRDRATSQSPDVAAFDMAWRRHSLTVLIGTAFALAAIPAAQFAYVAMSPGHPVDELNRVVTWIVLGGSLLGWLVGRSSRAERPVIEPLAPPQPPAPQPPNPDPQVVA